MAGHAYRRKDKSGKPIGLWYARYPDPSNASRRIERSGFKTKREADGWLSLQQASIIRGGHIDPRRGDRLFIDVVEAWQESWPGRLEPYTIVTYQQALDGYVLPEFGVRKVGSITHESVQTWVNRLQRTHLSAATVHKAYRVLRTAMGDAVRLGSIAANPCTNIQLPRVPRHEMIVLTGEEVAALAEKITPRYRMLVYFAAYTGCRAGEIVALRRKDIDLLRGVVQIRRSVKDVHGRLIEGDTKTHERRTISLPRFLNAMLAEHLAKPLGGAGPDAFVFVSSTGRQLRHGNFYRRHYKPAVQGRLATSRRAAVPGAVPAEKAALRFHDLRHTAASLAIQAGAHPKLISARLGHSSITITLDRYGHLFPSVEASLADALDAAFVGTAATAAPAVEPVSIDAARGG
jgi:integrase